MYSFQYIQSKMTFDLGNNILVPSTLAGYLPHDDAKIWLYMNELKACLHKSLLLDPMQLWGKISATFELMIDCR